MEFDLIKIEMPKDCNLILGMSHFIKSVEDIHELMITSVPAVKFGVAFCEASQDRLVRFSGNDDQLAQAAAANILKIGAGHSFLIFMRDAFPINCLPALKNVAEVVRIFCATANPVEVLIAKTDQGNGIIGVVDGSSPVGIEDEKAKQDRYNFLRQIGYKK
ncbi:MAG: adenosine-specific kinase [candidate division Zixibacteria bacterium]|nr:adenosine-specific kinase [candidate division Zixibacteria bacterium]